MGIRSLLIEQRTTDAFYAFSNPFTNIASHTVHHSPYSLHCFSCYDVVVICFCVCVLSSCYHQKMFTPPMPGDMMVNFYINLSKLCLTVYQLHVLPPNTTKVSPHNSLQYGRDVQTSCDFIFSLNRISNHLGAQCCITLGRCCKFCFICSTLIHTFRLKLQLCPYSCADFSAQLSFRTGGKLEV